MSRPSLRRRMGDAVYPDSGLGEGEFYYYWVLAINAPTGTQYMLQRSPDGTTWGDPISLDADATGMADTNLAAGTSYYYRVWATSSAGDSAYATASTATLPAASTGLSITKLSGGEIDIQWTDNPTAVDGYSIGEEKGTSLILEGSEGLVWRIGEEKA